MVEAPSGRARLATLMGLLGFVLLVVGIFSGPSSPDDKASGAAVIAWFTVHNNAEELSTRLAMVGTLLMLVFVVLLYDIIRVGARKLSLIGVIGFAVTFTGLAVGIGFDSILAEDAGHLTASTAQAINVLDNDFFLPIPVGLLTFGIFFGWGMFVSGRVPRGMRWMGVVAIILGVGIILPGAIDFIALLGLVIWVPVVSVWLFFAKPRLLVPDATRIEGVRA
jgi:hypothetical protein